MSCKLLTSTIQPHVLADIQRQLHLVPKENFFQQKTKEWRNKYVRQDDSEGEFGSQPIDFFYQDQQHTYLPLTYASSYFQVPFNSNIPYPKCSWTFTGNLLERQHSVATEAWNIMHKSGAVILGLYPGFGKTVLASYLSSKASLLTCVMICMEALIVQWVKTFKDFTNARVWVVGEPMPVEFDIIVCMDRRWNYIPEDVRSRVGTLIIDEAHMFCAPVRSSCFMGFQPLYVLPLTATIERDDGMEQVIYAVAGSKGIFRESDKPFQVIKVETGIRPTRKTNRMGWTDYAALQREVAIHPRRNGIIIDLVQRNLNFKILILTTLVDHTKIIHHGLVQHGINADFLIGGKRGYNDSNVLVGTMGKLGTGFDAATSCPNYQGRPFDLLIIAATIKQIKMLTQNVGRVFRSEFPTVLHLVDDDSTYKRHWSGAQKWYHNRSGTVTQMSIPPQMVVPDINIPDELLSNDNDSPSKPKPKSKRGVAQDQNLLHPQLHDQQQQYQQQQYQQQQYQQQQYQQQQYQQQQYQQQQQQYQQQQYGQQQYGQMPPQQYIQFPPAIGANLDPIANSSTGTFPTAIPYSYPNPIANQAPQYSTHGQYQGPLLANTGCYPQFSFI